jgi:hypothetical protein
MGANLFSSIGNWIGDFLAACIRLMVRLIGRRVTREEAPWLNCPMGTSKLIGADFYHQLAIDEQLKIADEPAGLLTDFSLLKGEGFDPTQVRQEIHEFYERTSEFRLEAWSEAPFFTRMFLWVLTRFVSRRMNQLNFPVSSLELAGGMTSDLLPMNNDSGQRVYTGWLRRLAKSGHVIYTGLYSVESPGEFADPCVKVSFPLPQGSATVFLRPEAQPDGSFKLISSGRKFGEPGFYRMVELKPGVWKVRNFRTLREYFHVYVDESGMLRTDHLVTFLGLTILRLHYKCERAKPMVD